MTTTSSFSKAIEISAAVVIAVATVVGAYVGNEAYKEYRATNRLSIYAQLNERDRTIASYAIDKDRPHMDAIWVEMPSNDLKPMERAGAQLAAIVVSGESGGVAPKQLSGWATVEELNYLLYSEAAYRDGSMRKLREAYMLCEQVLYTVQFAHQAAEEKFISEEELNTYSAYLKDIGGHPLFLLSIWYGHKGGYITKNFAAYLQKKLMQNEQAKQLASIAFRELLADSWSQTVGTYQVHPNSALQGTLRDKAAQRP